MRRLAVGLACAIALGAAISAGIALYMGARLVSPVRSAQQIPPADLPVREVSFESDSGGRLSGWFLETERSCGTVVLMHAARGDKRTMLRRARFLSQAGYAAFLFDFRAHGESGGDAITFGHLERGDAAAALRLVSRLRPNRPIGVIGFSLGGVAAVLNGPALGADALVLEAVTPSFDKAVLNRVRLHAGDLGLLSELLAKILLFQFEHRFGIAVAGLRPIDRVGALGAPVFVIAGGDDRHTTPEDSRALFAAALQPKRFWLVEGAGHVDLHRHDPEGYAEKVLAFLDRYMPCR